MSTHTCLNCGHAVTANYCPQCGQKATTHRFTLKHFFAHDLVHGAFHLDKGFLYTAKNILLRPHSIREYVDGKRTRHFNPVTFLLFLIAAKFFIEMSVGFSFTDYTVSADTKSVAQLTNDYMKKYSKQLYFISIPITSLLTMLAFMKSKQNFAEHLVMNTYREAGVVLISILFSLPVMIFKSKSVLVVTVGLQGIAAFIFNFRFFWQYFKNDYPNKTVLALAVIAAIILSLAVVTAMIYAFIVLFVK